jgi:hypothetical protein
MLRRQAYGFVLTYSVLSIIFSPLNLIGLPFGIWAITILLQDDVKRAFGVKNEQPKKPKPFEEEKEEEVEEEEESPQENVQLAAYGIGAVGMFRSWILFTTSDSLTTGQFDFSQEMLLGLTGLVVLIAAVAMYHAKFYWFGVTGCVLCLLSGSCMPVMIGVWSLFVLFDPKVRDLFLANKLDLHAASGSAGAALPTTVKPPLQKRDGDIVGSTLSNVWTDWWCERDVLFTRSVQTVVMLLHLGCLLAFLSFSSQATTNDDGQRMFTHEIGSPTPWFTVKATSNPGFSFHHAIHWSSSAWMVAVCGGGLAYVYYHIEKVRSSKPGYWDKPQAFMLVWCILAFADVGLGVSMGHLATNFNRTGGPTTQDAAGAGDTNRQDHTGSDEVGTYDTPKIPEVEVQID